MKKTRETNVAFRSGVPQETLQRSQRRVTIGHSLNASVGSSGFVFVHCTQLPLSAAQVFVTVVRGPDGVLGRDVSVSQMQNREQAASNLWVSLNFSSANNKENCRCTDETYICVMQCSNLVGQRR